MKVKFLEVFCMKLKVENNLAEIGGFFLTNTNYDLYLNQKLFIYLTNFLQFIKVCRVYLVNFQITWVINTVEKRSSGGEGQT